MKLIKFKNQNQQKGSSLVELVFYISIFTILVLVVINAIIVMSKSFKETTVHATLESGGAIMERMSRQIKQASSITSISPTDLVVVTKDQNGNAETVEFVLSGSNINFLQNGASTGSLNSPNLAVSDLFFTRVTTAKGDVVKISFSVSSVNDSLNRTADYYNTVVLRGDY
jgi:Tfp pilus assembly protein PilE